MVVPDVVECRKLRGIAPSTVAGKRIAKGNFNKFLVVIGKDLYEDLDEYTLCDPALLRKNATYLVEHYVTKDDKHLMCDSAKQYISGVFMAVQERFPDNRYYNSNVQTHEWYAKLRSYLDGEITLRCIQVGEEVASKSYPIGRNLLKDICFHLRRRIMKKVFSDDLNLHYLLPLVEDNQGRAL